MKMYIFGICSDVSYCQLKVDCHIQRMLYENLMVTTKQKLTVNIQKIIKESKRNNKESYQESYQKWKKKRRKEQRGITKTALKQ